MSHRFIQYGINTARSRPGLAGLLYGLNLITGLILTVPIYIVLSNATAETGFATELKNQFDVMLWTNIMQDAGPTLMALLAQLIWIVPVYMLWKIASSVGIIHTLAADGARSFWQGVGEHTGSAVLVALLFLAPLIVLGIGLAIIIGILLWVFPGEIGSYWTQFLILPILLVLGVALIDLMHDYARMSLVVKRKPVVESFLAGLAFPFRHGMSSTIYIAWFIVGAVLLLLPTLSAMWVGGIWLLFFVQQIALFLRAATSVGWFASELALYEASVEAPAIAAGEQAAYPGTQT
jgi:hypothetical protein